MNIQDQPVDWNALKYGDGLRLNPNTKWPNFVVDDIKGGWIGVRNTANGRTHAGSIANLSSRFPNALFGRKPI